MVIEKFNFPEISICMPTNKELLAEAKRRGFYNAYTPYNVLFSKLFFNGEKLKFKKGLDKSFKAKAL